MSEGPAVQGLRILPTRNSVAAILKRIQDLAHERGLTIFAQIDFSGDAERAGLTLPPTGMIIFGNPKAGTPLIAATPTVAIDLPLKILAWQDASGETWIGYNDPEYLKTRHRFPPELLKNIAAVSALAGAAAG
jgi:uncharacterized protein (DUF302 family)